MTNYHYNTQVLRGLSTKAFMSEAAERNRHIEAASDKLPPRDWAVNALSRELHPSMQFVRIAKVEPYAGGVQYTLVPDREKGTQELAIFRPGQFIAAALEIDGHPTTRCYHLCGSPNEALGENSSYTIMVSDAPGRMSCFWVHDHWEEGTELLISGPLGNFYYQELRDSKQLLGIGANGVFYSYARAIANGLIDADLTIVYPCFAFDPFISEQEKRIESAAQGRVKIVPVLYGAPTPEVMSGPITTELLREILTVKPEDVTVFADCIPDLKDDTLEAVRGLGVPERRIHLEYDGGLDSPAQDEAYPLDPASDEAQFTAIVHARNKRYELACGGAESLLESMERAGISVPADCRSGSCGWCHSHLIKGEVFVPESKDGRREASKKFGWIHPCCTYPLSDVELEVFPLVCS